MRTTRRLVAGCFAILLGGLGCGGTGAETPLSERIAAIDSDLTLGSTGDGVRALHEYLTQIGYFPNADLATRFPAWRPIVPTAPADPAVYDENTLLAVSNFQANMSLPQSGIVDAQTRLTLKAPRCGYPDGIRPLEGSDKFAYRGSKWPPFPLLFWNILNTDDVTAAQSHAAATAAFATWAAQTNLSFSNNILCLPSGGGLPGPFGLSACPDIVIQFDSACGSKLDACTPTPPGPANFRGGSSNGAQNNPVVIHVSTWVNWSVATPTPAGSLDLQTFLTHEIGHALGLDHSSFPTQMMYPSTNFTRLLGPDDKAAISSLYDVLTNYPGGAKDIGVGATSGALWIIGTSPVLGGYSIFKWVSPNWVMVQGGAVRIAVDSASVPWIVNSVGQIYRRNSADPTQGGFVLMPGAATDIGAGADGSIWITGTDTVSGGHSIFRWNGSGWDHDAAGGGAVRIAVDSTGIPWIVNSVGQAFRGLSTIPSQEGWSYLNNPTATDIGVYTRQAAGQPGGLAWIVAGSTVQIWDEQAFCACMGETIPAAQAWVPVFNIAGGGQTAVSTDSNGTPYIVQNNGTITVPTK